MPGQSALPETWEGWGERVLGHRPEREARAAQSGALAIHAQPDCRRAGQLPLAPGGAVARRRVGGYREELRGGVSPGS